MDCLQVSKDLITIFDWEPAGGQVASFQRAACACSTERHIWSQCKLLLFFPVPSTKVGVRAISSVQLLSHVPLLATPWTAAHQASLSITTPRVYSNSCPLSRWCHPTMSSSVIPFSWLQSFPTSGTFKMSQLFTSSGRSIGVSASTWVLPMNSQDWFPLGWIGWISCSPRDSQEPSPTRQFKSINSWCPAFFMVQLSHLYMTTGKTRALIRWTFVGKVMSQLFNRLSRLLITFLPRNKRLLISWLHSPSAVIWEPPKIKSATVSTVFPSICYELMGPDAMILVCECLALCQLFHSLLSLSSRGSLVLLHFLP